MQKLPVKLKNTPGDAPQVPCSVRPWLNREETLGAVDKVLAGNNSDVDQLQHTGGLKAIVYVLNKNRKPLMPCKPAKARHLLKLKKAKVIKRNPFTIQLNWNCEKETQPVTLGIDAGYSFIGFSAITEKKELIAGEVVMLKGMKGRIESKRQYRRDKRNKLWHRPARFLNRGKERYPYNDKYHFAIVSPSDSRLIDLLNVKYVLSKEEIKSKKYRLVYDKKVKIYENKGVLPRAFIVHKYIEEKDRETTLSWIENEIVNPAEAVILGGGAGPIPLIHQLESNLSSRERKSEVKIVHYSPNKIVLNASTDKKGILFLSHSLCIMS